jgi:hypothetical protein
MFVGWVRNKTLLKDIDALAQDVIVDKNLLTNTVKANPMMSFAIYDGDSLMGIIASYEFDNHILVNNFYYKESVSDEDKIKLINLLMININDGKTLLIMVRNEEKEFFKSVGFKSYAKFSKALYTGGAVFNFSTASAKAISGEDYISVIKKLDEKVYLEDRFEYITKNIMKQSSLMLSTPFGFCHSYGIEKSLIKIAPFIMVDDAYNDAEKLLRGVIYHRGLKTIVTFIPSNVSEIVELYKSYKFEISNKYELMYCNRKPTINLESIYGF